MKILVVSTLEHSADEIGRHLGDADEIKVVVPVVRQGVLDWLANDERAYARAQEVATETAEQLPGETVEAIPGEADVPLAIQDALATFAADEIVVAVRDSEHEGLIEANATQGAAGGSHFAGIPVRRIVIPES